MDQQYRSPWQQEAAHNLQAIVDAGEELLRHTTEQAGEDYRKARAKFENLVTEGKQAIASAEAAAINKARLATAKADLYVHEHPWQSVGYGAIAAVVIGTLAGLLIGRR